MLARLYDEAGREPLGEHELEQVPYVLVAGQPGLGPLRVFVYDGPVFVKNPPIRYERYREATVGFVTLKEKP